jgi:hypothetical protein
VGRWAGSAESSIEKQRVFSERGHVGFWSCASVALAGSAWIGWGI